MENRTKPDELPFHCNILESIVNPDKSANICFHILFNMANFGFLELQSNLPAAPDEKGHRRIVS
jgi:hypothetical protein